jgi:hypothetical protein
VAEFSQLSQRSYLIAQTTTRLDQLNNLTGHHQYGVLIILFSAVWQLFL